MQHEQISLRQFVLLLFTVRTSISMVKLEPLALVGTPQGWLSVVLGFGLGLAPVWLAASARTNLGRQGHPDWIGLLHQLAGRPAGTVLGLAMLGLLFLGSSVNLRLFTDLLTSGPMPETPAVVFATLLAGLIAYTVRQGIEPLARVAELLVPGALLAQIILMILGIKDMELGRLAPVLPPQPLPIVGAALTEAAITSTLILPVWALARYLPDSRRLASASVKAIALSGAVVALTAMAIIAFFGAPQASLRPFPLYGFTRTITVMDFFERMDAFFLVIWTGGIFVTVSILTHVLVTGLQAIFGLPTYRHLVLPLCATLVVGSVWVYGGFSEVQAYRHPSVNFFLYLPLTILTPAVLYLRSRWVRRAR